MALSAAGTGKWRPRGGIEDRDSFIVLTDAVIYHQALVVVERDASAAQGYLKPLASASGVNDWFVGVAHPTGLYSAYVTGDGTLTCDVDTSGITLVYKSVTGVASIKDVGAPVFATDDTVLTLTDVSNMYPIGRITKWYSSTYCDVKLYSAMEYAAMLDTDLY